MAERLRLTRTFGSAGWQAWHADGDGFVLAALGTCLLRPGASLALRGFWRLLRLWRRGPDAVDPDALRLALCLQRDVRLSGISVRVELAHASDTPHARTYEFALRGMRRSAALPAAEEGHAWTVLALAAGNQCAFAAMTAALYAAPRGTRLTVDFAARRTHAPDKLRADFPLRAAAQFSAHEGWLPLIRATRIDVAGALAQRDERWTSSTSPN